MQDINKAIVKNILLAIANHANVDKLRGLSKLLGINESTLYAWIKRGKIGNIGGILRVLPYINVTWLETGTGPMMILDKENLHLVPDTAWKGNPLDPPPVKPSKIVAQIQPGKAEIKDKLLIERQQEPSPEAEADDIEELQRMSERVLRSKTVYRSAWASNCRAFYQAVIKEEEMMAKDARIEEMAVEIAEIKALLRRLVGDDQKREQKAG